MKGFKKTNRIKNLLDTSNLIIKLFKLKNILLFVNIFSLIGCSNLNKSQDFDICFNQSLPCLQSTEYVLLVTNKGKIKLELYGESAPITVGSFVDFVEKGAYDNTIFNRVIREPYPYIIRGGDNKLIKGKDKFIDSKTGKIRYIPLEIKLKSEEKPIYGKEIDIVNDKNKIQLKHKRYYLSMARSTELNSASSQFYILLKSLPELDGRFAVFGKVISGINIVDLIEEGDFIVKASRL